MFLATQTSFLVMAEGEVLPTSAKFNVLLILPSCEKS